MTERRRLSPLDPRGFEVERGESPTGWWEVVRHDPDERLVPYVDAVAGYRERAGAPMARLQPASSTVTMILSFGHELEIGAAGQTRRHTSFAAGLCSRYTPTAFSGSQFGIQIDLNPAGAAALLHLPAAELAGTVTPLSAVDSALDALVERLSHASGWAERFAVLDAALLDRLRPATMSPPVDGAWNELVRHRGRVRIHSLVEASGWSHRAFVARFRAETGVTPKQAARILRFEAALALAQRGTSLADSAALAGYADQSHLTREFAALAGRPPASYLRDAATPVRILQDRRC